MFVKIKTLYKNDETRCIPYLSTFYEKRSKLKEFIYELTSSELLKHEIIENKVILLKPNWVLHSRNEFDDICLRTNDNFLLSILELTLENNPKKVIIGDAPIQSCQWEQMLTEKFYDEIQELSKKFSIPIEIIDFRKVSFDPKLNEKKILQNTDQNYVIFNLAKKSLLEPISIATKNPFRISYYNPDRLKSTHFPGTHKYCITKFFFEADVIISIPKIKTHQKSGITGALKNLVGINGDKDFLPHHRIGGTKMGGDCYPGNNYLRYLSEMARDRANRNIGNIKYKFWVIISHFLWSLNPSKETHSISSSWYGNDTIWRTVLDLNTIAIFGKPNGTIGKTPQRVLYSICDAIIAGQGRGPLDPTPLPMGVISFTNHSALNDVTMATLMGFDYKKISLLNNSINLNTFKDNQIFLNGKQISLEELKSNSIKTIAANGWDSYLNNKN